MKRAMERRMQVLVDRGDAQVLGQGRIRAPRDLVHRLETREIDRSGRFPMIDNGLGFSLVHWNNALERRIGQQIGGVGLPGGNVDWAFGRMRGLGL